MDELKPYSLEVNMRRTRASIIEAFAQLLEERPINKITVKDIVNRCDINRNTFYYHFPDIPSLLLEMMEEKVNALIAYHYTPVAHWTALSLFCNMGRHISKQSFMYTAQSPWKPFCFISTD